MKLIQLFNRDNGLEVRLWTAIYRRFLGSIGPGALISRADRLRNPHHIHLGPKVAVAHGARFDITHDDSGQPYDGEIHIGEGTIIEPRVHIAAATRLTIGRHVLFASNVFVTDHDHGFLNPHLPVSQQPLIVAPTRIEDWSWLGENVVVLKSVTIGRGAVIGANSVVTRDIPPFAIAAGAPARVIKMRPQEPPPA
jgi:acetyltransferase-like isoleucine patch superfamily enzyme